MSWRVVQAKWDGIREAFGGFDPAEVASIGPADITQVEADPRVIRNREKLTRWRQNTDPFAMDTVRSWPAQP